MVLPSREVRGESRGCTGLASARLIPFQILSSVPGAKHRTGIYGDHPLPQDSGDWLSPRAQEEHLELTSSRGRERPTQRIHRPLPRTGVGLV